MEEKIAWIATRNHGIVTRRLLLGAGLTERMIDQRVRKGQLIRVFRGVYRVGHAAPSTEALYLAAVRACGEGAVLGGLAAGHVYGIVRGRPPRPEVLTRTERRIEGVVTHRCRRIHRGDATTFRGIPITTVPKTLSLIAAVLQRDDLARAVHEAHVRYRVQPEHVEQTLARCPNSPGAARLRRVVSGDDPVLLSRLESRFFERIDEAGFPRPEANRKVDGRYVDCRWPKHGLTVELLSYRFHNSRHSWEQDHERRREARERGDVFLTFTWADVDEDPRQMLVDLGQVLPREA